MKRVIPYRWLIVALIFFLAALNSLDRQTLSVLAPSLRSHLGVSTVEYSYVVTFFLVAYTLGYVFSGIIIDRIGVSAALTLAVVGWSLAGMSHALARGWLSLAASRFALGLGESFSLPCGMKVIAEWVPKRERGLSTGIFSNGNIFGALIAPPLVSFIALKFSWQWSFVVTGMLGFGYLWFWHRYYDSPEGQSRLTTAERDYILQERGQQARESSSSLIAVLRHPAVFVFFTARLLTDSVTYFFSFWLPEYLQTARGFSLAMIGIFGWLPFLAMDLGGPGGGALSDWLIRRGWRPADARWRMMLVAACLTPCSILAVHAASAYQALALIALLLAASSCWMSNMMTLMIETFPSEHIATYISFTAIGGSIGGIIFTLMAGQIIHSIGYAPVFTVLGLLHITAFGLLRFRSAGFQRQFRLQK